VRVHGRSQTKIHLRSRTLRRYRDTAKVPLVVDAQRAPAPDAGPPMIIGAVRCPAHYIATWHRDRRKSQSVVGDFASRPKEVNPMLQALRANGIEVAALHRAMPVPMSAPRSSGMM
jgi:hypothetical protein